MTFEDQDIFEGYRADLRSGKNRRKYSWHEGRKRAFYVWIENENGDAVSVVRYTTTERKPKEIKLRGPSDLSKSDDFQNIKKGEKLNYPFLTKTENRILTMRSLGKSRPQIARALSGGRSRRSLTANSIKYILQTARQKIREHKGRLRMKGISANLEKWIVDEVDRIAEHQGKTRNRLISEAVIEYINNHQVPNVWETEHFTVDFNRFNRLRKRLMDLENDGFIGIPPGKVTREKKAPYEIRFAGDPKDYRSLYGTDRNEYQWRDKESTFFQALFSGRYHPELTKRGMTEGPPG